MLRSLTRPRGRPTTRLTRDEAAARLGVSVSTLINLERRGQLTGKLDLQGKKRYALQAVEALRIVREERAPKTLDTSEELATKPTAKAAPIEALTPSSRHIGPHQKAALDLLGDHKFSTVEGARQGFVFALLDEGLTCKQVTMRTGIELRVVSDICKLWKMEDERSLPPSSDEPSKSAQ